MLASEYYIRGDQEFKVPAHLNFGQYMIQCLRKTDKNVKALINGETGEETTYGEFLQTVADVSVSLSELGIGKGHTVAICSERNNKFVATTLAVICTGATYTPLDVGSGRSIIRHKFEITKPSYVICSQLFWEEYKEILQTFDCVKHYITFDEVPENATPFKKLLNRNVDVSAFEAAEVKGTDDVAMVLYSSGTTGPPKGVMLTHLNLLLSCNPTNFCDSTIKVLCNTGQWYHNYDSMGAFVCLSTGRTLAFVSRFAEDKVILKTIEQYKVEMFLGVPVVILGLTKCPILDQFDLSTLKYIYSRSTYLHANTIQELKRRLPNLKNVLIGYGMTEAGEPTSESRGPKGPKLGSVGTPSPGTIIKIVDVNTREQLGPRKTGEICVKGPALMKGYIGIPRDQYLDAQGFLKTGDLGYYDEDQYVYILDRMKDVIKYIGFQVSPAELEAVLQQHSAVMEAGVVGRPDDECGELPAAFVVRRPGSTVTERELVEFVASEVSPYMQLRGGLKFVPALPRNERGKLLRRELKELLNHA